MLILKSLNFPAHFFVQLILAQALPPLLLILIATEEPRLAAYLLISAAAVAVTALATEVSDVGLLLGETLPFYATIFILVWNGALPVHDRATCSARSGIAASGNLSNKSPAVHDLDRPCSADRGRGTVKLSAFQRQLSAAWTAVSGGGNATIVVLP